MSINSQQGFYGNPESTEAVDPDSKLGPGDELTMLIEEDKEGSFPKLISATGEIDVPPYGRVKVAGKTTAEASADIKRLLEKDFYYTATVRLSLDRRRTTFVKVGSVTLGGEIRGVGLLDLQSGQKLTVSQAIQKVGGFTSFANQRKVQVTRTEGGSTKPIIVDVKEIIETGRLEKDLILQDGDRIFVPRNIFQM